MGMLGVFVLARPRSSKNLFHGQVMSHTGICVPGHIKGLTRVSAPLPGLRSVTVAQVVVPLGVSVLVRFAGLLDLCCSFFVMVWYYTGKAEFSRGRFVFNVAGMPESLSSSH